jgi:hypothetical protein
LPAASAAFFAAMSIWWSNENCSMEPVKGHPSPTPNTVDSSLKYEDFEESELDMNRLPVYTRCVFELRHCDQVYFCFISIIS